MGTKKVQLNLYIPESYRDQLQRVAAERMLRDPRRSVTASRIAAEIVCDYLNRVQKGNAKAEDGGIINDKP